MLDVITVGSATVDVFVYTDKSELISFKTEKSTEDFIAYPSGTKMLIKKLLFKTGGGGTNTAVSFSRIGLNTGYIGCLGKDDTASAILGELHREDVAYLGSSVNDNTDYSVILNSIEHDRTILNYKGSSTKIKFDQLKLPKMRQVRWMYFSSLVGDAYRTLEKLSDFAVKNKIKIAFNPSSYLAERGPKYLGKLLRNSNVIILNKEEAKDITKQEKVEDMLRDLQQYGAEHIIITDGKQGVHALCKGEHLVIEPHKVKVIESTGAGDAFASTFVAGLILKRDVKTSLQLGMANAESILRCYGAKENLLSMPKLRAHIRAYPYKIKKMKL